MAEPKKPRLNDGVADPETGEADQDVGVLLDTLESLQDELDKVLSLV